MSYTLLIKLSIAVYKPFKCCLLRKCSFQIGLQTSVVCKSLCCFFYCRLGCHFCTFSSVVHLHRLFCNPSDTHWCTDVYEKSWLQAFSVLRCWVSLDDKAEIVSLVSGAFPSLSCGRNWSEDKMFTSAFCWVANRNCWLFLFTCFCPNFWPWKVTISSLKTSSYRLVIKPLQLWCYYSG